MNLGNLWFGVDLKDNTGKQADEIKKHLEKALSITLSPTIKADLRGRVMEQLREPFNIKLEVEKESREKLRRNIQPLIDGIFTNRKNAVGDLRAVRTVALMEEHEQKLAILRENTRKSTANADAAEVRLNTARANAARANERLRAAQDRLNLSMENGAKSSRLLNSAFAKIGGVVALEELARKVVTVSGEFEFMEQAIKSLVGSEVEGVELMGKLREFAKVSPLEVRDVTKAAQTLLGFNVELAKVPDMIQRLGDVSMGNKDRFNALALAFAQTTSAARLTGEDLRQYVNAGFNPLQVIAEKTGKSMRELKEEMSKGAISVEMVEQAFIDATSAGGKFYNMSEKQTETINGQLSKLGDSIDRAFESLGRDNQGIIRGAISSVTALVDNYEQVGRVLMGLLTTYGTYRTALLLTTVAQNGHSLAMNIARLRILATQKAQALLNATMLSNPYVVAATALGVLVGALIASSDGMTAAERAQKNFNDAIAEGTERQKQYNAETEQAISTANSDTEATGARREALNLLIDRYGDIIKKYIDEKGHLRDILQLKREIAAIDGNRNIEDLTAKARRYSDAAEAAKLLINGKPITNEQKKLIAETKEEYFGKNGFWAKAWFNENDLLDWAQQMAGEYGKKARREASINAQTRFQDVITNMTGAQLKALQGALRNAKSKKKSIVLSGYKELSNVVLTPEDIERLMTYTGGIADSRRPKARTKKVIEEERKAAQTELEALTVAEANGKKGAELRRKIAGYSKELEAYDSKTTTHKSTASHTDTVDKMKDVQIEQALAARRRTIDLEHSTRQAEISAMEDGTEKVLAQIELDHDKRLEAIRREFEDLRQQRIKEAKSLWDADSTKKGTSFYNSEAYKKASSEALTEQQQHNRAAQIREANKEYADALKKQAEIETRAMFDYLSQFGSIQQMRLAIKEDYDSRIARTESKWQKKQLEKERDAAIGSISAESLLKEIDLSTLFNEYGIILASPLEETLRQLKKYTETDSFKSRSFEDQQSIYQTIRNTESQLNGIEKISFSEIGESLYEYNNSLIAYRTASDELAEAAKEAISVRQQVADAEEALAKATTDEAREIAMKTKTLAKEKEAEANQNYNNTLSQYNAAQSRLASAQSAASENLRKFQISIDNVGNIARAVASGSMKQLWDSLGAKNQKRIGQFVAGTKKFDDAVGLATSLLSKQGKGMDYFVERVQGVAAEIYESGEKIETSGLGEKIAKMFDELFGKDSSKMKALGDDITKILGKVLNDGKKVGANTGEVIKQAATEAVQAISKSGGSLWVMVVGLIMDLLDVLSEGVGALVETLLDKVGAAIEGVLSEIGSGKFFERIFKGVGSIIGGVVKGIGNLFSGGYAFGSSNVEEMEKEIAELAQTNEALAKSIESLAKSISDKDSTNSESEEAYKRALAAEKEWQTNQRKAINDRASEWSGSGSGFMGLGGKHSFNAYLNEDFGMWDEFNKVLSQFGYKNRVNSANDLWQLSPEMMQLLRDYAPKAWAGLLNTDGKANPSELINEYIEKAGKIDELTSALNEKLTGYTWDSFKDSYLDIMRDLDSTNEDFADSLEEKLSNAILRSLINETYKDRIKALYEMIADAASDESEGGSTMTASELAAIRAANESLSNDLIQARKNLMDAGILKDTGGGSSSMSNAIKGVTEQTADLLASYINTIRADESVVRDVVSQYLPQIAAALAGEGTASLSGIRESYVSDIANAFRGVGLADVPQIDAMMQITPHLDAIAEMQRTGNIIAESQVSQLQQIVEHTKRTADNTEAISIMADDMRTVKDILRHSQDGSQSLHVR